MLISVALVESWKASKRHFGIASGKIRVLARQDAEMRAGLEGVARVGSRKKE